VFKTTRAHDEKTEWICLRLLLEEFKVAKVVAFLEEAIVKRHYYTPSRMVAASGITLPSCLWSLLMGSEPEVDSAGDAMYCTELCMLGLQHVGLLDYYPAEMCTPNDLLIMAGEFSERTPLNPTLGVDALGLRVSGDSIQSYLA